jgi:hypothetical protein
MKGVSIQARQARLAPSPPPYLAASFAKGIVPYKSYRCNRRQCPFSPNFARPILTRELTNGQALQRNVCAMFVQSAHPSLSKTHTLMHRLCKDKHSKALWRVIAKTKVECVAKAFRQDNIDPRSHFRYFSTTSCLAFLKVLTRETICP